ncbi:PTH1 family peptidyl-tRNA hydrolase [Rhizobium binae]|uniref:Peptidyl-tRNA hydrolase n=1 Tax=Rhizobium binae TaxID=1138190 RepID=A0ABV2M8V7_9HYPH|nr:aminoacyl-tRNA hydrolase [Rhizobium binae]MBX4925181.1 aminoacyl-tRNA hydrolase [Rhizobium binae]MBX4991842.1 aminoacyl-tRNA hydrolase [Rhizobium binae]NKL50024.1 aminoacyl-tRNA hydrolase [Rhizobium leguminosarum bv. viciae]QSY81161.1 aminoacyl-tRNA hydrolase [Rhizobium binae]
MLIIAGLGNPGGKYAGNRHNIGFMAVDAIHRRHSFSPWSKKFKAEIAEGELGGEKVLLIKPQTYMNLSGEAVGEAMRFYKLQPADLVAIYDELDLPPGKARLKTGGGHGGHNGIRSLDAHCGKEYRRLRLGIGHPGVKEMVQNHVLGDFAKADRDWLEPLLDTLADNAEMLVRNEDSQLMNKIALALGSTAEEEKPRKEGKESDKRSTGQSHIRQARNHNQPKLPATGPMAEMLKKIFGNKGE